MEQQILRHLLDYLLFFVFFLPLVDQLSAKPVLKLEKKKGRCGLYLSHVDCKRLGPAIKQLEEKQALPRWNFICVVDHKHVIRLCSQHPGHAVVSQEGPQVVIRNPTVLLSALGKVVKEHVENLVSHVVIRAVEEELQETAGVGKG